MQSANNKNQKVVTLICDDCHCCPEVIVDQNQVMIKDDFGGKVKLSKEQFALLKEKVSKGEL